MNEVKKYTLEDCINLFNTIDRHAVEMECVYKIIMQLFGSGSENVELLNKWGSNVFAHFAATADAYIVNKLVALTEERETQHQENLSVKTLRHRLLNTENNDHIVTQEFIKQYDNFMADLGAKISAVREFRHKHISHIDLEHALEKRVVSLQQGGLREAMKSLYDLLNHAEYQIKGGSKTEYEEVMIPYGSDGEKLFQGLRLANKYNDNR